MMNIKDVKPKVNLMDPTVRIGKSGITDAILVEIKSQLRKKSVVKIRVLKSSKSENPKQFARELAAMVDALLVQQIGSTITLCKK